MININCILYIDRKISIFMQEAFQSFNSNGIKVDFFNSDNIEHLFANLAENTSAPSCIVMNYPIESNSDITTIIDFCKHVSYSTGYTYYAPRPNNYISIQTVALIGINLCNGDNLSALSVPKAPLPYTNPAPQIPSDSKPPIVHPNAIKHVPVDWRPWSPSYEILRHDLVDRAHYFFPHPRHLHVILLNRCNLQCIMCPYHSPHYAPHHPADYLKSTRMMSDETFLQIARYAGSKKISMQIGQIEEPLMHPSVADYITVAKALGVPHIHMTTNGTLLNRERAIQLSESGIDSIMFSLDASTPETYRKIRGVDLNIVEENIAFFMPLAKRHNIKVTVSFILQDEAVHEREQFLKKWAHIGVNAVTFYALSTRDPHTGKAMRTALYQRDTRYACAQPWLQGVVFPEGEISLCCKTMSDIGWRGMVSVGNLNDNSFDEIWFGQGFQTVRSELLRNAFTQFKVCEDCDIWSATSYMYEKAGTYNRTYNETCDTYQFI